MVRSAQTEHPGRLLLADLDEPTDAALALAVAAEEPQVAVRAGAAYAPDSPAPSRTRPPTRRPERSTRTAPSWSPAPAAP
ncbi:hypothetical protein NKG94_02345 [Micromonospora sp. M12]